MIKIRPLTKNELKQAIELKIMCWTEELAGKAENNLIYSEEYDFWVQWMNSAEENHDIRLLIGAFEDEQLLGVAFSSFAEAYDIPDNGIELNGFWVFPQHRNKGVSLRLLKYVFDFYLEKDMKEIVIYNHHYSSSNTFYRKFGAKVIKQVYQMDGKLQIDVFLGDIAVMKRNIEKSLEAYVNL